MNDAPAFILAAAFCAAAVWCAFHKLRHAAQQSEPISAPLVGFERWGTDTALHDQCALIWDLPAHDPELEAGCDRLWAAIRDEQQNNKGDQP